VTTSITLEERFNLSSDMTMVGEGPSARRHRVRQDPERRAAVVEAKRLLDRAYAGDRVAMIRVNEAITTSDLFKSAAGEVLDRELLAQYEDIETQWTKFAARTLLKDFKRKQLVELTRNRAGLRRVPEHTNYPIASTSANERFIQVAKFGEQYGYTLEARINDDIGELQQVPNGWATQARYTEDDAAIALLANPLTGAPNTAFFNVGNGNLGTGALTAATLQAAITTVSTKRDKDGRIIRPGQLKLYVGPSLQFQAELVINTSEIEVTLPGGTTRVKQPNPFRGKVQLEVLENLPGVAWFLAPAPAAPRPAFYVGFLRGFETPDVRQKNDQGRAVGGGDLGNDAGSFDDDTTWFRVRHITGAAHGDPLHTYASDGVAA
jgi:hypothetical protein